NSSGIQAAINAIPATGGSIDLPCGTYTITATLLFPANGLVKLAGCGTGSSGAVGGGTRLVASSGAVTPIVKIQGASAGVRATDIFIRDLTIQGVYTTTQECLQIDHATAIDLRDVQFVNCGQAEWVNDAYQVGHHHVSYVQSGSGGTNTTAT